MGEKPLDIKSIFGEALEKKTTEERAVYLDKACGNDANLRDKIEALLRAYEEADDVPEAPIIGPELTLDNSPLTEGPGTKVGRYKLLQLIGEGGFACVYMAEQAEPVRRKVALKIIKLGMDTKQVIGRFEAERQALAMMDHPNIAKVFDGGATDTGRPYFVMELVKGIPITDYCDDYNFDTRSRLQLFVDTCRAVQHAHQKGIIHRDIKPSNVMVTLRDGRPVPKVIDFGIAKAMQQRLTEKTVFTEYRQFLGTPEYMSPEQAQFSELDVDTRTDIYSLGVLLYELLTGTTPLERKELLSGSYDEMLRIIRETDPPKTSTRASALGDALAEVAKHRHVEPAELCKIIRGDLDWVVMKTLEKDRTRRYETANELAQDVERHLVDEPVLAGPPSAGYRLRKFVRRHRTGVVAGLLVAAALVIGLCLATVGFVQASREKTRTGRALQRAGMNFQMARDAVGEMTRVAEEKLADAPEMKQVQAELLQQAQIFYAGFLEENSDDPAVREEIGQAYLRLGGIHRTLGQHTEAEDAFENAIDIFEEMAIEYPEVFSYREDLADGYGRLAGVLQTTGRLEDSEEPKREEEQLRAELLAEFPSSVEHELNLAGCRCELGELLRLLGALDEAEQILRQETDLLEKLTIEYPDARGVLAGCYFTLGHILSYASQHEESAQVYQRSTDLQKKLVEDFPDDPINRQELAQNMVSLGMTMNIAGRTKEAEVVLREAADLCQELVMEFPQSGWEWAMAEAYHHLSEALNKTGRHEEAEQVLRQALEIKDKLAAEFPDVPAYRFDVAAAELFHLADTFLMAGRMEQWEQVLGESLELHEEVVADYPDNAWYRQDLVNSYRHQGGVLSGADREEEAAHAFQRALELQEKLVDKFPRTACYKQDRANIFAELGQALESSGRWEEAEEVYQKAVLEYGNAIELDPNNVGHWEARGRLYMDMERWDEAIADFSEAIELASTGAADPGSRRRLAQMYRSLADVLRRTGQLGEAEKAHEKAEEIEKEPIRE
jgi:non-specific serine/threonine protein kinase/serine/threonine-protein kinase